MTLAQLIPARDMQLRYAHPSKSILPAWTAVVYSFDKIVSNRKTSEGGMKAHVVIYIPMVEENERRISIGISNFNGIAGFPTHDETKYNKLC
ncbi:hypothetical protein COOONC_20818 [Cooperia oncophora]